MKTTAAQIAVLRNSIRDGWTITPNEVKDLLDDLEPFVVNMPAVRCMRCQESVTYYTHMAGDPGALCSSCIAHELASLRKLAGDPKAIAKDLLREMLTQMAASLGGGR